MAFDGFTVRNIVYEMNRKLIGGHISKISQPETDEINFLIKGTKSENGEYQNYYLTISANPAYPLVCIDTQAPKEKYNPTSAPNFCMVLRKHIANGRIVRVTQPGFERVIDLEIEHRNEMADLETKHLMIEIMGKHSNLIFCGKPDKSYLLENNREAEDNERMIIDSIKHIPSSVSSVREVLPGRRYFIPKTTDKTDPDELRDEQMLLELFRSPELENKNAAKAIYTALTGFSPFAAEEIISLCGIDSDTFLGQLNEDERYHLAHQILIMIQRFRDNRFEPSILSDANGSPIEFAVFPVTHLPDAIITPCDSASSMLREFYAEKELISRIRQKSADLRKILQTHTERTAKKLDLQEKQYRDTEKKDRYKIYGDLVSTFAYSIPAGSKQCELENYYDENRMIKIALDESLTASENAAKFYEKYAKLKRTREALELQIAQSKEELDYLTSVQTLLEQTTDVKNLSDIKEELARAGYVRKTQVKQKNGKNAKKTTLSSQPYHFLSSDGFHIYVGKNNLQNDELSFGFAEGNDLWFHAKKAPGSHVIVKTNGAKKETLPDRLFEEAGALAAYFSSERSAPKVEIDYIEKKFLKKPPKAKPGFVIYHTNYSLMAIPDITKIESFFDTCKS